MTKIELVRLIGNEVCEGCDEARDCGEEYDECIRIHDAVEILNMYLDNPTNKIK